MKIYLNHTTTERGTSAAEAMSWHRAGDTVQVLTYDANGRELNDVTIKGAKKENVLRKDENTAHCEHIANELDMYVYGNIRRCPHCGEEICRDEWDMFWFNCPECGADFDPDKMEQLSVWDFLDDVYDIEFRTSGKNADDLKSVQIMVACGGPNIYLNTDSCDVELYWWTEKARWPLSRDAVQALDDWAEEYWGCL